MKRAHFITTVVTSLLLVALCFPPDAWGQKGGGGKKPRKPPKGAGAGIGEELLGKTHWADTAAGAVIRARADDLPILLYVYPAGTSVPDFFESADMSRISREDAVFCKMKFDKDDKVFVKLKIDKSPLMLGLDMYGNEFARTGSITISSARDLINGLPPAVASFEQEIDAKLTAAEKALDKGDTKTGKKHLLDIVASGKRGYEEIDDASEKLGELAAQDFKEVDKLQEGDKDGARAKLKKMTEEYKGTPAAAEAEIRMARIENDEGNAKSAVKRLLPILDMDADHYKKTVAKAEDLMETMVKEAETIIAQAERTAMSGDKEKARETINRVKNDYAGTEAEKKAKEALKALK